MANKTWRLEGNNNRIIVAAVEKPAEIQKWKMGK